MRNGSINLLSPHVCAGLSVLVSLEGLEQTEVMYETILSPFLYGLAVIYLLHLVSTVAESLERGSDVPVRSVYNPCRRSTSNAH